MIGRKELTSADVRKLVFKSFRLIEQVQKQLNLPICPHLKETKKRLSKGVFKAEPFPLNRSQRYSMDYGAFDPPSTIILDSNLPFCDRPLSLPQLPKTLAYYSAIHEVIHADDYTGGNKLLMETRSHILSDHRDKLEKGMLIIEQKGCQDSIGGYEELAGLWALQYLDMATHYRTYVVLRNKSLPKLEFIWAGLRKDFFPPHMFTCIEQKKGAEYVFEIIHNKLGKYCLIDALKESESITQKNAFQYTV